MRKNLRLGVDVDVAFASTPERGAAIHYAAAAEGTPPHAARTGDGGTIESTHAAHPGIRQRVKALLRPLAQTAYRLLKPGIRPIALRARRYLIAELQQEIRQEIQHSLAANLNKLQEVHHLLRQDVLASRAALHQELQQATAHMVQELQKVRPSLHGDGSTARELVREIGPALSRIETYSHATARRVAVNCGNGAVLVKTEAGFVLCGENDHALLACLVDTGELERGTRLLIEKFLRPGDCFIDVGANIGLHTLAAARSMQGQGKIIAFEPFGPTKALLERSVWMNGFSSLVEIHQAAVSNETGHHKLFLGATSGHHSLFPLDGSTSTHTEPVEVSVVRIDDVVPATQKVDLLKIDAEGAELQVMESAAGLIERNAELAIIVEFGPAHLERTGVAPGDWLKAFAARGLQYRAIDSVSGKLEHWDMEKLLACDSINLLFGRKDAGVWRRLDA
ncbi:FkbM family methyltransferase [Burkholderia dolosa]|uniref:FkbM family methyltransferase n=1 Tax=Burkholderia dolosa TaxID=152500 RepID=A0A892I027_9BURK|nr:MULTISPECIES: FkbM family methyltransferase [Burkholderia]AJY13611.1 methyltransferase, FkbM family domain protein [Burkholderia dolosa AU0158]AYZ96367.1 FkbM family methyltransferase [Burkholderia dolosa]MBR8418701.1 FkbM family methyltransferase [Burkholderia dolosa]MBY4656286.1 FkbM family methyltransferase [Burkholderia dolosa]MBY4687806.1 FkbM family methyltransferase [Burkholderia dolosa]